LGWRCLVAAAARGGERAELASGKRQTHALMAKSPLASAVRRPQAAAWSCCFGVKARCCWRRQRRRRALGRARGGGGGGGWGAGAGTRTLFSAARRGAAATRARAKVWVQEHRMVACGPDRGHFIIKKAAC